MNAPATAEFLECNASLNGNLSCGPVIKAYRYLVQQGSRSRIKVVPSGTAPEVWLCDKTGNILAHQAGNLGDIITFDTVLANQTDCYYLFVASSNGFFFNQYSVSHTLLFGNCAAPTVQIVPSNGNVCTGDSFSLSASSPLPNASYLWSGPNGFSSTQPQISFSDAADSLSGVYTLTVTVPGFCPAVLVRAISVKPLPTVAASVTPTNVCAGTNFTLNVSTNATVYAWSGPYGYTSTSKSPQITVADTAHTELRVYAVTVTAGSTGCTNTSDVSVQINARPTNAIISPANGKACFSRVLQLDVATNAQNPIFFFFFPFFCGFTSMLKNPQVPNIDFDCHGNYTVTVTDLATGCSSTSTKFVSVNSLPLADISGGSISLCAGETRELTGCCSAQSYLWSTGETTKDISVMPLDTTKYSLTITDANGCTNSDSTIVMVKPLPSILIIPQTETEICSGQGQVLLCVLSNATDPSWQWAGPGFSSALQCISLSTPQQSGIYSVIVTDGVTMCTNKTNDTVVIHTTPTVSISQIPHLSPFCEGESFTLCASSDASGPVYKWDGPDNLVSADICVAINNAGAKHAGNYNVTVTDIYNCQNSTGIPVDIDPVPIVTISGNISICEGATTTLTAAGGLNFKWSTGENGASISVSPAGTTIYTVTVTNNFGCESMASATVVVLPNNLSLSVSTNGNNIQASTTGGQQPYTYSIYPVVPQSTDMPGLFENAPTGTYTIIVSDALGCTSSKMISAVSVVEPFTTWGLLVMPNPSDGLFEVILANLPSQQLRLDVFAGNGRLLRTFQMETMVKPLDLTDLPNGMYVLRISDREKTGAVRLVIMRY